MHFFHWGVNLHLSACKPLNVWLKFCVFLLTSETWLSLNFRMLGLDNRTRFPSEQPSEFLTSRSHFILVKEVLVFESCVSIFWTRTWWAKFPKFLYLSDAYSYENCFFFSKLPAVFHHQSVNQQVFICKQFSNLNFCFFALNGVLIGSNANICICVWLFFKFQRISLQHCRVDFFYQGLSWQFFLSIR